MESKRAKSRPAPQTCGFRLPTLLRGHPLKTPERSACKKIFYPEQKKTSDFHRKKKRSRQKRFSSGCGQFVNTINRLFYLLVAFLIKYRRIRNTCLYNIVKSCNMRFCGALIFNFFFAVVSYSCRICKRYITKVCCNNSYRIRIVIAFC